MLGIILDHSANTVAELDAPAATAPVYDETPQVPEPAPIVEKTKRTPVFVEPNPPTEGTASTLDEEEPPSRGFEPPSRGLDPHVYRNLIQETVRETIEQLVRSGELIRPRRMSDATDVDAGQNGAHGIDQYDFGTKKSYETPGGPSYAGSYTETFSYEAMSKTLRELWSPLLDIPVGKIYDNDSFFELGGDSILAMELAKSTRDAGIALTVADIFGEPVFSDMVYCMGRADMKKQNFLAESDSSTDNGEEEVDQGQVQPFSLLQATNVEQFLQDYICPKVGIFRGGIVDAFPATDFQALAVTGTMIESRWMLNYLTFDGEGNLDIGRLRKAALKLVDSFEILRTVFVPCSNRFLQVVLRTLQPQVNVYDTDLDFDVFTKQLRDSDSPRLGEQYMQMSVIRKIGSRAHRIILRLSHAQYDGVCLPKMIDSLRSAYEGKDLFSSPPFSAYIKEACGSPTNGSQEYWKKLLEGSSMTEVVPRHNQQPRYESSSASAKTLVRNVKLPTSSLRNITEATILKAAWSLTLAQLSGQSDLVFGNLISGRNVDVDGVESIVGPCLNIVPIRLKLDPKWTAFDLLRKIQSQQVSGMPYESLGFRSIVQNCTAWPEWTYYSTIVQHQNITQDFDFALDRISYKIAAQANADTLADMVIVSTPKGGDVTEITLSFTDDGASVSEPFAQGALDSMCTLVEKMVRNPTLSIMDIVSKADLPLSSTMALSIQPHHQVTTNASAANSTTTKPAIDALLRGPAHASKRQITDIADMLARAWRTVLPPPSSSSSSSQPTNHNNNNNNNNTAKRHFILNLDSSFYESGGDLISLASLAAILEEQGYELRLEDLISKTTMGEQV
ncbi:MAG: hypothetical protein Q9168_004161, partial [Polycauliona sp. 1 TL-2023]